LRDQNESKIPRVYFKFEVYALVNDTGKKTSFCYA